MKIKLLILLGLVMFCSVGFAQNNQVQIDYNLSRLALEVVGGDLTLPDNAICPDKVSKTQDLFEAVSHGTVFFRIDNRGGGNSCVTLVVETASGTIKVDVPEDDQTGILKFLKVKNAYLTILKNPKDRGLTSLSSIGVATVWF